MWPFRKKLPPRDVEQQAAQSNHTRFNPSWKFSYERTRLPDPGAQNYAWLNLGLVEFSPIGAGTANRKQLLPMQPQASYARFATVQAGLGGLVQGTIYGQPLISFGGGQGNTPVFRGSIYNGPPNPFNGNIQ